MSSYSIHHFSSITGINKILLRTWENRYSFLVSHRSTTNIRYYDDEMIVKALDVIAKDRTVIVIAHRLSTIVRSDKIVVLDYGQLVEEGNHKELLALDGKYANMYRAQIS